MLPGLGSAIVGAGSAAAERVRFVGYVATDSGSLDLTSLTGGIDTAAREDDLVIVVTGGSDNTNEDQTCDTPGFVELADLRADATLDAQMGVFWKKMTSTPDTSVSADANSNWNTYVALVFRGQDLSTPFDATLTTATGTGSAAADAPSITTVTNEACVVAIGVGTVRDDAVTAPSGYTDAVAKQHNNASATVSIWAARKTVAVAGAENPAAWSDVTAAGSGSWCAVTLAIRPA
jgi:hypothetical protein